MRVAGVASSIPERRTSITEDEKRLDLEEGWIERRTGILRGPSTHAQDSTSDLAVRAASLAIQRSRLAPHEIGLVLLATSTPDHLLPPTAPLVAYRLGLRSGAIDLAGACSGSLYAIVLGSHWVDSSGKAALVI